MIIDAPIPAAYDRGDGEPNLAIMRGRRLVADINTGVAVLEFSGNPDGTDTVPGWAREFLPRDYVLGQEVKAARKQGQLFESFSAFVASLSRECDELIILESGSTEGWFGPGQRIVIERDPWGLGAISVWNGCQNVTRYQSDRVGDYFLVGPYAVRADQEAIKYFDRA